ncbi:MAG: nucleoside hydrolase [Erysipelotrichaceae bacterium]|nr:nucleoside hydrolase [Erysipelotrichaceae bacterium]
MPKMKMIIDCDTGIDDALAISYILANPDIEFLGVSTTFGNIAVDQSVKNSLLILENFGRSDVKVYRGADHGWTKPVYERSPSLDAVHGHNGIGDVDLGEPKGKAQEQSAVDFIIESARKYGKDLHLVFVGPLANFANCIKKDEEAMRQVGNITIMGGALTVQGNRNIYAEANIADDPVAAKYVFGSGVHFNIIPLDATLRTLFKVSDIEDWQTINQAGKKIYDIARFYYIGEYQNEDIGGAMHDPLAAFASYDPSIITNWYECNLTVEENGRMIGAFEELNLPEKRHKVALDVDAKRFTETYIEMLKKMIENCL